MKDKKVIFHIGFNTFEFDFVFINKNLEPQRLKKEWIDYRMDVFMKHTYKSLINQTNQSFTAVINYVKSSENLIFEALSKYPKLAENVIFTCEGEKVIKNLISDYEYLYMVRLDSDDMYHPSFVQQLIDFDDNSVQCIINQEGYVYDINEDKLGLWYALSPPFYTHIYKVDEYLKGYRHKLEGGHLGAINLNHKILQKGNFMVIIHGGNTSTTFSNHNCTKSVIDDKSLKKQILNEFNIN
ncbi:hypothetical protein NE452_06495 [Paeniclostridium sordellii]|uniref:hypothetical protein n=1 Tax=Paraclostridium sordellii TaxID=1505 RepID=UPI0005DB62DD|nr:hypothetical protein [Paeniclostridium sordellii]MCQ4697170.1 hypothetical protein [Paeniclostridium sordellii]CEO25318.1 Uncharacterised protein [[Clostridium] sordellii] [Paeniclostridium sordellii]